MQYRRSIFAIILTLIGFTSLVAQTQRGKATYYSRRATGARTASGQRLHHDSMTCAHRTYPFGTLLKVTNLSNKKQVIVKVTDRGPFARGRIIDLSWGAAKKLGILSQGVAMVKVEVYKGETGIPYRPDDKIELPEIDFEVTEAGYSFIDDWMEDKVTSDKKKANRRTPTGKKKAVKKSPRPHKTMKKAPQKQFSGQRNAATHKAKAPQKKGNKWSEVFEKLKNWGEDLFN